MRLPVTLVRGQTNFVRMPEAVARPLLKGASASSWSCLRLSWDRGDGVVSCAYVGWAGAIGQSAGIEVPTALAHAVGLGQMLVDMPEAAIQVRRGGSLVMSSWRVCPIRSSGCVLFLDSTRSVRQEDPRATRLGVCGSSFFRGCGCALVPFPQRPGAALLPHV